MASKGRGNATLYKVAAANQSSPVHCRVTLAFPRHHCLRMNQCKKVKSDTVNDVCKRSLVSTSCRNTFYSKLDVFSAIFFNRGNYGQCITSYSINIYSCLFSQAKTWGRISNTHNWHPWNLDLTQVQISLDSPWNLCSLVPKNTSES